MAPFHVDAQCDAIALRHVERCRAGFHCHYARCRAILLDRKGDRTATGSEVECRGEIPLQRKVNEQLGLRPWDEYRRVYCERQAVKLPPAKDVGDRFTAAPTSAGMRETTFSLDRKRAFRKGENRGFAEAG